MKKLTTIILFAALLCSLLCLTGCSPKTAITAEDFCTTMEAAGYTVVDVTDQYAEHAQVTKVFVAIQGSGEYKIEFYVTDTSSSAEYLYGNNMIVFERSTGSSRSRTVINGLNSNTFKMTTSGQYRVLSRIDNTLIYVVAPEQHKSEINEALKSLGY